MRFRPLYRYIRYHFAYAIRPAKQKDYDYIGEVKAWIAKENTSPYKDNPNYFSNEGTFEDWYQRANKESQYTQSIIRGHNRNPWATLSQLRYKPKPEEKKLSEARKLAIDETDLEWELRAVCDKMLLARSKGNTKIMENWSNSVNIEEMEGLARQEIDELGSNDTLNEINSLMYFNDRGGDEYIDIDGIKRKGKLYGKSRISGKINKIFRKKK